ncbi:hypothetical protein CCR75_007587 [Bremia lactucae]|uniref:Uncharacterized protein n=1 Tax=Bremia lactucae TaxID=4779 RepID=A0A976FJT3_BRELC|nr:hypothetical protein CCR75_007587 [Bremia lactucae]
MSGLIIGIVVGIVVLCVIGYIVYINTKSQHRNHEKSFMHDFLPSKVTTSEPTYVSEMNVQDTPSEYDFTTLNAQSTKVTSDPLASSIAMLHALPSTSPSVEPKRYNFDPAQSTVNGAAPSTSPFNKRLSIDASRPSHSNFDAHSMEFNAAPGSYAESYTESYAGSFVGSIAESYANSFSGTYDKQGVLNSFDLSVDDLERDTVGTTVSEALDRQTEAPIGDQEQSHWMDDMRGTNDSYAMLESGSFDRTSALSRFSTDSDLNGRPTT